MGLRGERAELAAHSVSDGGAKELRLLIVVGGVVGGSPALLAECDMVALGSRRCRLE
jgi:hypothetical protein